MKNPRKFSNFSQSVDSTRLSPIQSALPSPRIEHLFFDFLVHLEVGSGAKKGFALSKSMDTHTSWSRAMPMPLLFVSLFLLYLKLNYVEKVMKREIGNGFCDGELLRTVGKIDSNSGSNSNLTDSVICLWFCT